MDTKPIKDKLEYEQLLKQIEARMDAGANTIEGERLDKLVIQAETWEQSHHPINAAK